MTFWNYTVDFLFHLWKYFTVLSMFFMFWTIFSVEMFTSKENSSYPFVKSYHIWILCIDAIMIINYMIAGITGLGAKINSAAFTIEDITPIFAMLFVIGTIFFIIKVIMTFILYNKKCKEFSLSHKKGKVDSSYN